MPSPRNGRHLGGDDVSSHTRGKDMSNFNSLYTKGKDSREGTAVTAEDSTSKLPVDTEGTNVFAKASKRIRKNSCPEMRIPLTKLDREDLPEDKGKNNKEKRKMPEEESPPTDKEDVGKNPKTMQGGSNRAAKKVKEAGHEEKNTGGSGLSRKTIKTDELINKLDTETRKLREFVKDNRNTKVEIKQLSKRLRNLLTQLTSIEKEEEAVAITSDSENEITLTVEEHEETPR